MDKKIWFEPLGMGMNQKVKGTQIKYNESKLLYNISFDKVGVWRSSKGRQLKATTLSGTGGIDGLMVYKPKGAVDLLIAVAGGNTYRYDGVETLESVDTSTFTTAYDVMGVNFLNRLYMFSSNQLNSTHYLEGTTVTDFTIKAKYGIVAQDSLWAGNINGYEDRFYVSRFDEANNIPTHNLYETGQDITTSTRYFLLDGAITGGVAFKDSALGFTKDSVWSMDVRSIGTQRGASKLFDVGTTSNKSIAVDSKFNSLFFVDGSNGVNMWGGAGDPINISDMLIDKTSGVGVIDLIERSNLKKLAGHCWDGKYYLSLYDLTDTSLEYYQDACLVYDIAGNKWALRQVPANNWVTFDEDGEKALYFGASDTRSIYRYETGDVNEDSEGVESDITSIIRTKDFCNEFGNPGVLKTIGDIVVLYSGTGEIEINYSKDGSNQYNELKTPITLAVANAERDETIAIKPIGIKCRKISFEIRKTSGTLEIIAIGINYKLHETEGIRPT